MILRHLGYACINRTLGTKTRTVRLANVRTEKLIPAITQNLDELERILRWNVAHGIRFFRVTSDLIPFASHEAFPFDWQEAFAWKFDAIRRFVKAEKIRLTMHPGQYTVLNSPEERIVANAIAELDYHARLLQLMADRDATMTLHVGGVYGDKAAALDRFARNVERLSDAARSRLILENDDTSYHVDDVLGLCQRIGVPLVFDFFHHRCLPPTPDPTEELEERLEQVVATWGTAVPKFHLSSGREDGPPTAHADYIEAGDLEWVEDVMARVGGDRPYDVMLEAKEKECALLALQGSGDGLTLPQPAPTAEG